MKASQWIQATLLLAVIVLTAANLPLVTAVSEVSVAATQSSEVPVFWCPMRGNPCAVKDYSEAVPCEDCGMELIARTEYEAQAKERERNTRTVGIVLFDGFEVLDVYGPLEMWAHVKEFNVVTVAESSGPIRSAQGIETIAQYSFEDCPRLQILVVPGGMGTRVEVKNEALLGFLRERDQESEITASVCTGSSLLAKAGLLDGYKATTNKHFFEHALEQHGKVEWVREARWVDDGKVITSSGVSAGMDMALHLVRRLYGEERARQIAAGAEYIWNEDAANDPFANASMGKH